MSIINPCMVSSGPPRRCTAYACDLSDTVAERSRDVHAKNSGRDCMRHFFGAN